MPESLSDAATGNGELIFPDDAAGDEYELREANVYDADEVRERIETDDVPRFGRWLPVNAGPGAQREAWLNAPSALIEKLQAKDVDPGDRFSITEIQKPGHEDSNPYQVSIQVLGS